MTKNKLPPEFEEEIILDFELIIGDAGGQIDNGDVPIRWCVAPDFVKKLEDKGVVDPHVLIASYAPVKRGDNTVYAHEMDRRLVPLAEMMTYLRFTRAGNAKVYGVLLDGAVGRADLDQRYMRKQSGGYETIVDRFADDLYEGIEYSVARTSNVVEIPANVFGKEPSPWVKWYVNVWHDSRNKISDECDFRKRFFIAFAFKWMAWIPFITVVLAYRLGGALGMIGCGYFKKVKLLRAFRPYKYPGFKYNVLDYPIDAADDNFFIFKRKNLCGYGGDNTSVFSGLAFTPLMLITIMLITGLFLEPNGIVGLLLISGVTVGCVLAGFAAVDLFVVMIELIIEHSLGERFAKKLFAAFDWLVDRFEDINGGRISLVVILLGLLACVFLLFKYILMFLGLVGTFVLITGLFFTTAVIFADKLADWLDRYFALKAKDNDYSHLTELLCAKDEDNLRPNYNYIPKKQRTIRLWYHAVKNQVCKPMQD